MKPFYLTPLIIATALFMENLDSTIISTSLPAIAIDLKEDPISLKLALTSYLLSLAIFIPASGWAADKFGSRTVFRSAILVFTFGSILCGLSSNLPEFVAARMVQGLGGALMVPVGRLVLFRSVPRSELVRALAYLTTPALIGPVLGPPLGGFITTYFHWRWIFWLNVPIGVVGFILASIYIQEIKEENPAPLDLKGFLLTGGGLSAMIFGFTAAGRGFVSNEVTAALVIGGALLLFLYVRHSRRVAHPILDLDLLKAPTFFASVVGGFVFRIGVGAIPFLLPLMLQFGFGMTAFQSGLLTFASSAGALLMKPTAGPILRRIGFRRVLVWNTLISCFFIGICAFFTPETPHAAILVALLLGGFLRSLQFTSINAIAYADISNAAMSRATSFAGVNQQLSLSVGVAVGAAIIEATRMMHGQPQITAQDFAPAFAIIACISTLSVFFFLRLPANAGEAITGKKA